MAPWTRRFSRRVAVRPKGKTRGLCVLPDELLLEIISQFAVPPTPTANRPSAYPTQDRFERREVLIALSQTCRRLRRVFHPCVWERIDVYSGMMIAGRILERDDNRDPSKKWEFYKELSRQLHVVTTLYPTLSKGVRIVDIEITDLNIDTTFFMLAHSFSLFPNLHTVMIVQHLAPGPVVSFANQKTATLAFGKYLSYPQIKSAILSIVAYPLLALCPNLRSFEACSGFQFKYCLESLLKSSPHLQRFSAGRHLGLLDSLGLAKEFPSLEEISVLISEGDLPVYSSSYWEQTISQMGMLIRLLKNLRVLTIENRRISDDRIKKMILSIPKQDLTGLKQVVIRSKLFFNSTSIETLDVPIS